MLGKLQHLWRTILIIHEIKLNKNKYHQIKTRFKK